MARWVTAAFLLLVAVATARTAFTSASPYDEAVYRGISRNILRTGLPIRDTAPRTVFAISPPLGLCANAGIYGITADSLPWARLLGAAFAGAALVLVARALGREMGGRRAGLAACSVLALIPLFARELPYLEIDVPVSVLFGAAVWSWVRFAGGCRGALLTGLLVGLAGLTKYSAFLLLPLIGLDFLLSPRVRIAGWSRRFLEAGALALPSGLLLLLWHMACLRFGIDLPEVVLGLGRRVSGAQPATGDLSISLLRHLVTSAAELNVVILSAALGVGVLAVLAGGPRRAARRRVFAAAFLVLAVTALSAGGARLVRYQDPAIPLLAPLAAVFLQSAFEHPKVLLLTVAGGAAAAAAIHLPLPGSPSFGAPAMAPGFAAVLAVAAVWALVAAVRWGLGSPAIPRAALFAAIALGTARTPLLAPADPRGPDYGREAGALARSSVPAGGTIAVTSPTVAYHADRPYFLLAGRSVPPDQALAARPASAVLIDAGYTGAASREALSRLLRSRYRLARIADDGTEVWLPAPR